MLLALIPIYIVQALADFLEITDLSSHPVLTITCGIPVGYKDVDDLGGRQIVYNIVEIEAPINGILDIFYNPITQTSTSIYLSYEIMDTLMEEANHNLQYDYEPFVSNGYTFYCDDHDTVDIITTQISDISSDYYLRDPYANILIALQPFVDTQNLISTFHSIILGVTIVLACLYAFYRNKSISKDDIIYQGYYWSNSDIRKLKIADAICFISLLAIGTFIASVLIICCVDLFVELPVFYFTSSIVQNAILQAIIILIIVTVIVHGYSMICKVK